MNGLKKHRGMKRYYKNLVTENELNNATWPNLDDTSTWTKNWHFHFDSWGYGNNSFKKRKTHLDKLFRHFDLIVEKIKILEMDFQLYAILLDLDSTCDAIFLHTPNPNNNQFQFKRSELQLTTTLTNEKLNDYVNNIQGYEKLYGKKEEAFCLIFKRDLGQPFYR